MKIVQLIYSLTGGGAERFTVDLSNQLAKTEKVYLLLIVQKDKPGASFYLNDVSKDVNIINLGLQKGLTWKAFYKIYLVIKKIKPDVVNAHLNTLVYLFPLVYIFPKVKFYHTLHNPAEICTGVRGQDLLNRFFYRTKIRPITISELSNKSYRNYYKNNNSVKIDNGRSKPLLTAENDLVRKEIESYKQHDDDIVFIHVARCHVQKNQLMLIKVFNKLLENGRHVILLICGSGFDSDLGVKIKNERKYSGIYFLGAKQNIADYLNNSDCFILSSIWEGLPISLLEAMSYGIIPISTPAGGIPSVVEDGVSGILAKGFTEDSFYQAIISFLDKKNIIKRENVIKRFNANFSMEMCAKRYLDLYKL